MTDLLAGYLLLTLSFILFMLCGASFVATIHSLTVSSTLSAIESSFGTLVLTLLLFYLARKTFQSGKKRLKSNS